MRAMRLKAVFCVAMAAIGAALSGQVEAMLLPMNLVLAPDGAVWIADWARNQMLKVSLDGSAVTPFPLVTSGSHPNGITIGPDEVGPHRALWITEEAANKIARVDLQGHVREYALDNGARPQYVAASPDGQSVWFTELGMDRIGHITVDGTIIEYPLKRGIRPFEIAVESSGGHDAVWFTSWGANAIGRLDPTQCTQDACTPDLFPIPTAHALPTSLTIDTMGNIWFTETAQNQIGRLTPAGHMVETPLPSRHAMPKQIRLGADGHLWYAAIASNRIGRILPDGVVQEFLVPTQGALPSSLTTGPSAQIPILFTESATRKLGKVIISTSGQVQIDDMQVLPGGTPGLAFQTSNTLPKSGAKAPDGSTWLIEEAANKLARIDANGRVTDYPIPTPNAYLSSLAIDANGRVWFTEGGANKFGSIDPTSGRVEDFDVPPVNVGGQSMLAGLGAIAVGADHSVWMMAHYVSQILKATPMGQVTERFSMPQASLSRALIMGPDHALWYTDMSLSALGRMTMDGHFQEFPTPTPSAGPMALTLSPDAQAIWFVEESARKVGKFSLETHDMTEYLLPTKNAGPTSITAGEDGKIWVAERDASQIASITPDGNTIEEFPLPTAGALPQGIVAAVGKVWFPEIAAAKVGAKAPGAAIQEYHLPINTDLAAFGVNQDDPLSAASAAQLRCSTQPGTQQHTLSGVVLPAGYGTLGALMTQVTATVDPLLGQTGRSTSRMEALDMHIPLAVGLGYALQITADAIETQAEIDPSSDPKGQGTVTVSHLKITGPLGWGYERSGVVEPNTAIWVPGVGKIVVNEQPPMSSTMGKWVNGLHLTLGALGVDYTLGQASAFLLDSSSVCPVAFAQGLGVAPLKPARAAKVFN